MAKNQVYNYSDEKTREREVNFGKQSGDADFINDRPCVLITSPGGATETWTGAGYVKSVSYATGGIGNLENHATVAYDGTWKLPVTGATTSTGQDVPVYIITASGATQGNLTLTEGTNDLFGYTDYPRDYAKSAGSAAVRIGD